MLDFRRNGDYDSIFNLINDNVPINDNDDFQTFIEFCNDNIFFQGLSILLKNELLFNYEKIEPLIIRLKRIDDVMLKKNSRVYGYITRILKEVYLVKDINISKYDSLEIRIDSKIKSFRNIHLNERNREILKIINKLAIDNNIFNMIFGEEYEYIRFISYRTDNINSEILNAIISKIMNISLSDSLIINKIDNKIITISELRIINIIRNSSCNLDKKLQLILDIMSDYDDTKMDNTIYEVIEYFIEYVVDVEKIDNLILIHKYTSDMWKNGSKYLYFYTLHNQEHAIDLIKNSIRFIRSIDFIQVKLYDYYLIFLSCYLHDISMVKYPDMSEFTNLKNKETNLIYHDLKREIGGNIEKRSLISIYKKVDDYFEMVVRNNHAYDSSEIIRTSKELNFLDSPTRELVSQISVAHGFNSRDIYKVKSNALNSLISEKYDKIILRFADLLDISGYRVSIPILNNNINNMSNTSGFHWISHHYISGYEIITRYEQSKGSVDNYLDSKSIIENIEFNIKVNAYQFTAIENEKCDRVCLENIEDSTLVLSVNKKCKMEKCNFMCKWLLKKNNYLYDELAELEVYLNSNELNYYKSKITIKIEMDRGKRIKAEYVDKIVGYIN